MLKTIFPPLYLEPREAVLATMALALIFSYPDIDASGPLTRQDAAAALSAIKKIGAAYSDDPEVNTEPYLKEILEGGINMIHRIWENKP